MLKAAISVFAFFLLQLATAQTFSTAYTLPVEQSGTPQVNCLYQLNNGYILAGTTTGLYKFDGSLFYKIQRAQGVPQSITAICETNSGIWLGFADGSLGMLQNNRIVLQNPEEGSPKKTIRRIIQTADGMIWMATAGEGVYYYSNHHFYNINMDDGLSDNYVYDIVAFEKGIAAGTDKGINFCNIANGHKNINAVTTATGKIPDNIVRCLAANGNHLWYGMQDAGVGTLGSNGHWFSPQWEYGTANAILTDGNLTWVAAESGLLLSNNGNTFNKVFQGKISSLLSDSEGNTWAGSNNQLVRFNGSRLQALKEISAAEASTLHTLLIDHDNHIWYNVKDGLKHLQPTTSGGWQERLYRLPVSIKSQVTTLYEDIYHHIWIGTMGNGVFIMDDVTGKFRKVQEQPLLANASVLSITGKGNKIWIASLEGAASCVLNGNSSIDKPYNIVPFNDAASIGTNYIYSVFIDSRNRTWFATDGKGVAVYDGKTITHFNQKNGLKSEVVYQIREDRQGHIWFITFNAGLIRYDGRQFTQYGIAEGLSDLNITSLESDQKGNLYVGHRNSVDVLNTRSNSIGYIDEQQGVSNLNTDLNTIAADQQGNIYFIAKNTIFRYKGNDESLQPKVVIDRIQLFLNDVEIPDGHRFSSGDDNISFYYSGITFSQPARVQYQYKLEGYGDEWITTNDRRRDFPKLPPGHYTFRVKASLNGNFEHAPEATFRFVIAQPIWQRWWFVLLTIFAVAAILYWFIKDRDRRLQKWERLEKDKIQSQFETLRNQVNPHFLFNSFNTLISEIEEDPKRAVEYVEHMADFFRSIVTYREKDVITLREELSIIHDYLFIQKKRYGCAFTVDVSISEADQDAYLLAPLTLQLLAENAIKHNAILREKPLLLEVFIEAGQLIVRNNINPKLQPEKSSGLGLQNIQKRYELLTGKQVVISNDDEFYTVIIPLIKT